MYCNLVVEKFCGLFRNRQQDTSSSIYYNIPFLHLHGLRDIVTDIEQSVYNHPTLSCKFFVKSNKFNADIGILDILLQNKNKFRPTKIQILVHNPHMDLSKTEYILKVNGKTTIKTKDVSDFISPIMQIVTSESKEKNNYSLASRFVSKFYDLFGIKGI